MGRKYLLKGCVPDRRAEQKMAGGKKRVRKRNN